MNTTSFSLVYDSFLSKITDDMYLELTELDTFRMLEQLLCSAIERFEFPRVNIWDYDLFEIEDERTYCGVESQNIEVPAIIYSGGCFNTPLTHEEINILSHYMIVEWLSQQLASVENTRMKYSGSDFKFTSQANHMQKLLQLKKDYEREGFHLQRLYKRRKQDKNGIMRSTFDVIMKPIMSGSLSVVDKTNFNIDKYTGEYSVNPNFNQQILYTKNKMMTDDMAIEPIEVSVTSNTSGGNTIYIGGIING